MPKKAILFYPELEGQQYSELDDRTLTKIITDNIPLQDVHVVRNKESFFNALTSVLGTQAAADHRENVLAIVYLGHGTGHKSARHGTMHIAQGSSVTADELYTKLATFSGTLIEVFIMCFAGGEYTVKPSPTPGSELPGASLGVEPQFDEMYAHAIGKAPCVALQLFASANNKKIAVGAANRLIRELHTKICEHDSKNDLTGRKKPAYTAMEPWWKSLNTIEGLDVHSRITGAAHNGGAIPRSFPIEPVVFEPATRA